MQQRMHSSLSVSLFAPSDPSYTSISLKLTAKIWHFLLDYKAKQKLYSENFTNLEMPNGLMFLIK